MAMTTERMEQFRRVLEAMDGRVGDDLQSLEDQARTGLGGGAGGIRHYLDHLGPSQVRRWESLGRPELSDAVKDAIVEGVEAEAAGRTLPELEARRDRALIDILKARTEVAGS